MNNQKISMGEAQSMNRHSRRKLGKLNGVKIPGSNTPNKSVAKKYGK